MDNLGKENFWNQMEVECPHAVGMFKLWIDQYKKEIEWSSLFAQEVKFHDIPYELQMGIMNRFFIESFASKEEYAKPEKAKEYRREMEYAIRQLQQKITNKN